MQLDFPWIINEIGILLEIAGAVYIVRGSMRARSQIDRIFSGLEGLREVRNIRDIMRYQAMMERNGFLCLSSGLIMQFVSNW